MQHHWSCSCRLDFNKMCTLKGITGTKSSDIHKTMYDNHHTAIFIVPKQIERRVQMVLRIFTLAFHLCVHKRTSSASLPYIIAILLSLFPIQCIHASAYANFTFGEKRLCLSYHCLFVSILLAAK